MSGTPNSTPPDPPGRGFFRELNTWLHVRPHRYFNRILALIALISLFRFWFAGQIELVEDEAYYWLWSNHLDICYYSKGPLIAWTIAAGTALFGDSEFGIRFFSVLLAGGTGIGIFLLTRRLFSPRAGFYAVLLAAVTPLFAVGSVLMTIDPLSVFFWVWAAYAFWMARTTEQTGWWLGTGFLIGLGMLAKYTNIVQLLCFSLFCLLSAPDRSHFRRPAFWMMFVSALACLTPTVLWNRRYDWITLKHLLERGNITSEDTFRFRPGELIQFLQEQALAYSPVIFISVLAVMGWALWKHVPSRANRARPFRLEWIFLTCLFFPLFLFYLALSVNEAGEANWTGLCYPAGFIALAAVWTGRRTRRRTLQCLKGVFILSLVMTIFLHSAAWVDVTRLGIPDPLKRVKGARHLALEVSRLQESCGASFIVARRYQTASLLSFYMPGQPTVYVPYSENIVHQFSFWPSYVETLTGESSALYISKDREYPEPSFVRQFRSVHYLKEVDARHRGRLIRPYYAYLCDTFLGLPEEE